jgi:ligand-binding SRPBCC domain-containing protein
VNKHAHLLERQQWIVRPIGAVFAFFSDAANLQAITPPWLDFCILTQLPVKLEAGALLDYRIRLLGVRLKWRTVIEDWQPPYRFVDRQVRGPYALWHHTHEFVEQDGGVLMTDRVRYRIGWGPLGSLAGGLFVRRWLDQIFDFRRQRIAALLPDLVAADKIQG